MLLNSVLKNIIGICIRLLKLKKNVLYNVTLHIQKYLYFAVKNVTFKTHVNWGAAEDTKFGGRNFTFWLNAGFKTRGCRI
jgi:hypothetical protein